MLGMYGALSLQILSTFSPFDETSKTGYGNLKLTKISSY